MSGNTRRSQASLGGSSAWSNADAVNNPSGLDDEAPVVRQDSQGAEESQGCVGGFKRVLRAVWRTNQTEDTKTDRELYIKTTLRELIVYCLFLVILMILTFGMTSATMYYYTKVMSELFLDSTNSETSTSFKTTANTHDYWRFLKEPLMNGLYWDTWYNSANISNPAEKNFIYYENKLLGVPRIRQVKVRSDSCVVASNFREGIKACYAQYSPGVEDKEPFGYKNSTAWRYSTEDELKGRSGSGTFASYGGGGFYVDLARDRATSTAIINELFRGLWITRGTRAVFIDFTVYNANINLFCVVKLLMEFPPTGGALPTYEFRTVKLLRYVEPMDYFVLACEVIFMLFICYYIVEEAIEIKRHKLGYFKDFWNWLDILVIAISLVCACFNVYRTMAVGSKLTEMLKEENKFPDFDFLSYWQQQFNHAIAITVFFAWVKIFKYISFNKTMTQLSSTLGACAMDLLGFAVMFFIIFFAFAQLGYLIFGSKVNDFREFQHAVFTLFRIILGDFDFNELERAHSVLGPAFFLLYVFFVFFVLINMFLAIINDTYSEVKADLANQPNEFEMSDFFKERAARVLQKLNIKRDKIVDIQKAIQAADLNQDKQLDFSEWRAELKMRGYADCEIEALFSKYDLDGDRILDADEQKRMLAELEGQKAALTDQIESEEQEESSRQNMAASSVSLRRGGGDEGVSTVEFVALSRRVDRMEKNVGGIVAKIDTVLSKLEKLERAKLHRRETMSRLLESMADCAGQTEAEKTREAERLVRQELNNWGQADEADA